MEDSELSSSSSIATTKITVIAKYGKEKIVLSDLPHSTRVSTIKELLQVQTNILPLRQKLVGLTLRDNGVAKDVIGGNFTSSAKRRVVGDDDCLCDLKVKYQKEEIVRSSSSTITTKVTTVECILMGTPEDQIFVDPSERKRQWEKSCVSSSSSSSSSPYTDTSVCFPEVIDDFDLDFTADSELWIHHVANQEKLKASIDSTTIHIMNAPRTGYPLLVLDLDHTLLDFSPSTLLQSASSSSILTFPEHNIIALPQQQNVIDAMKRPYMDQFLSRAYRHYDIVVWSQTSWRWLETKLIELGMLSHPHYRFCFVLDKTSMFPITSTTSTATTRQNQSQKHQLYTHHVKPLQLIWSKFSFWMEQNTIHIDDLARNFALNSSNGLQVAPYYRQKKHRRHTTRHRRSTSSRDTSTTATTTDVELIALSVYLERLAVEAKNEFHLVDFSIWMDVVKGIKELKSTKK
jgi:ubiquitin-like domain-containing CTD phosphatase 1